MKYRKMILQLLPVIYLCLLVTVFIFTMVMCYNSLQMIFVEKNRETQRVSDYLIAGMERNENFPELVDYWRNHYEEMDITYDNGKATDERMLQFYEAYAAEGTVTDDANHVDMAGMSDETKKLYAEAIFMEMNESFDQMKALLQLKFLYAVAKQSDNEIMYVFTGALESENRGTGEKDVYMLGHTRELDPGYYGNLFSAFEENSEHDIDYSAKFRLANLKHSYTAYHSVVNEDGSIDLVIGMSVDTKGIWKQMLDELFKNELYVLFVMMVCAGVMSYGIYKLAINPVIQIQQRVTAFGQDRDTEALHEGLSQIQTKNEFQKLANEVDQMGQELQNYLQDVIEMNARHQKIETEMSLAANIQASALSHEFAVFPKEWGVDLFATMKPAKEVGGDFYSFANLGEDKAAFIIADVSGKGIPAALFMMYCKVLLEHSCKYCDDPAEILTEVNEKICQSNTMDMFVTVWIGILDRKTMIMKTANAGHEYPIIKHADGSVELFKDKHGLVLGGMEGVRYPNSEIRLQPGDMIFVYTDGATECNDIQGEMFGTDRILQVLTEETKGSAQEYVAVVRENIREFAKGAEQFDDVTLMAIGIKDESNDC